MKCAINKLDEKSLKKLMKNPLYPEVLRLRKERDKLKLKVKTVLNERTELLKSMDEAITDASCMKRERDSQKAACDMLLLELKSCKEKEKRRGACVNSVEDKGDVFVITVRKEGAQI